MNGAKARQVALGVQNFVALRQRNCFYVDKTDFIRQWWQAQDEVTVIMRPRRFGKTLNMSMVNAFFSLEYKEQGQELFGDLAVWQDEEMRQLQGSYPVIFLSFASLKADNHQQTMADMQYIISELYGRYEYLLQGEIMDEADREFFREIRSCSNAKNLSFAVQRLSGWLRRYHQQQVIILLDEYDTPMQEAYVHGYWDNLAGFLRQFFNATFKNNRDMARGLMTGITRIAKESIFSDLNHLLVATVLEDDYADCFGFTEEEVAAALAEYGLRDMATVKKWYDGFCIGSQRDMYNPWSIINYLRRGGKADAYWSNTSSNKLVSRLLQGGSSQVKKQLELLLQDQELSTAIESQVAFNRLDNNITAVYSLLVASGYLTGRIVRTIDNDRYECCLHITNYETCLMFRRMVSDWFQTDGCEYNEFIHYLLQGDVKAMNVYMNRIAMAVFSSFDTGSRPSTEAQPERFYHGFVLGLMVDLRDRYVISSNRESGFGRYDVMLEPRRPEEDAAIIIEFKVHDEDDEADLSSTVRAALKQIEDRQYATELLKRGVPAEKIRKYGFAFQGKRVLIGQG